MTSPLAPGSAIGILGGGQLGRMLSLAAARLGLRCHVYDPAPNPPAGQVCEQVTTAAWDDVIALEDFARSVSVVTYEFENVPTGALDIIGALVPIRPGRRALAVSQDRLDEKQFLNDLGLQVAPFAQVDDLATLETALDSIGRPAILKTRRFGYDGKGQARITPTSAPAEALSALAGAPAILESVVPFDTEISVIGARGLDGQVACFDPAENLHIDGILARSTVPAAIQASIRADAALTAGRIMNALEYVGVMGVELFVTSSGLVVNEIAPRVHNSGHWTQAACLICQFEQHMRAVAGWPLGDGARHSDAVMQNLIGDQASDWHDIASTEASLHLYGKAEARAGRKMGHVIRLTGPAR